jgi:D-alanyl-D-alanine carboxypeptidase (penicillin-binding protein 5/6)
MFLIFRAALKKKFFRDAIRLKTLTFSSVDGRKVYLKSHNKSLSKGWKKDVYGKTGYTNAAKACFVGYVEKGRQVLIVAVFGCSSRWEDVKFIVERYGGIDL